MLHVSTVPSVAGVDSVAVLQRGGATVGSVAVAERGPAIDLFPALGAIHLETPATASV